VFEETLAEFNIPFSHQSGWKGKDRA
jgi:hypothetical protein